MRRVCQKDAKAHAETAKAGRAHHRRQDLPGARLSLATEQADYVEIATIKSREKNGLLSRISRSNPF